MDWNRKKMWPAAAASLVAFTSLLNAADDTQMRNLENRVNALEQRKGSNGMINPPARPVVSGGDFFLQGDALYWRAVEDGLGYVIDNDGGSGSFINSGTVKKPKFKWDWGFKLAAGYNMPHDGWDLFLQWTWFKTRHHSDKDNSGNCCTSPTCSLFPVYTNPGLGGTTAIGGCSGTTIATPGSIGGTFSSASANWKLRLNLLDLELGREFYVSKWLTMRPFTGLRAAWINQRYDLTYGGGPLVTTAGTGGVGQAVSVGRNIGVNMKSKYWGVGLRAGLDTDWGLGAGWSLFNDLAIAILAGQFKQNQSESGTTAVPAVPRGGVNNKNRAGRVTTDMELGVRWQHMFSDDSWGMMLQLAWEQHMFFNQNRFMNFVGAVTSASNYAGKFVQNSGDLETHGVTFSARFDF